MKKILRQTKLWALSLGVSIAVLLMLSGTAAAASPSQINGTGSGGTIGIFVEITGNGTTAVKSYKVTGTTGDSRTIDFTYTNASGNIPESFYNDSDLTGYGVQNGGCNGAAAAQATQRNQLTLTVTLNGSPVTSSDTEINMCNLNDGDLYAIKVPVTSPNNVQAPASIHGTISYTDESGNTQPFESSSTTAASGGSSGTLTNNTTHQQIAISIGSNGSLVGPDNSTTISGLAPGNYTLTVNDQVQLTDPDYAPATGGTATYNKTFTLTSGEDLDVSQTVAYDYTAPAGQSGGGSGSTPNCEASGFSLSWVLCPIIEGAADAADGIYKDIIVPLLKTQPINVSNTSQDKSHVYEVWSSFRVYGDIFLILSLLIIVFAEGIGGGLIDAYTAKKVLPRLLLAAILINLSIYFAAFAVDITNILGAGIANIIEAPFQVTGGAYAIHIGGTTGDLGMGVLLAGVGAAWIGGGALFSFLFIFLGIPVLLTLLGILVIIVLRQGLIIFLVMVSPIAFALYCLPNTEQYFRKWWELFIKTLLIYPIIAVLFALGNVLSVTTSSAGHGLTGSLSGIVAAFALFAPLFLIPFSFRLAGGLLGRFHEFATTSRKKAHEGILGNPNDANSTRNRTKRRLNAQYTAAEARAINQGKNPNATGWRKRRASLINRLDGRVNERQSEHTAKAAEIANKISSTGNDDDLYAANYITVGSGQAFGTGLKDADGNALTGTATSDRYFNSKGKEIDGAYARSAAAKHAKNQHEASRTLEYAVRKVQTDDDMSNFRRAFAATAQRQGWTEGEMKGVHAASTFEHKDKVPELWYEQPRMAPGGGVTWDPVSDNTVRGRKNQADMVGDLHKTREAFRLGSLRDSTVRSWHERRQQIQTDMDAGAPINEQDARFYAQTNEILDAMVSRQYLSQNGDEGPVQSGASAATQGVLKAMMTNRRYEVAAAQSPTGEASSNERIIYDKSALAPPPPGGTIPYAARLAAAADIGTVGNKAIDVTGDAARSAIPRTV